MQRKNVGQVITREIMETVYGWRTNQMVRNEMRWQKGISGCDALFIAVDNTCGIKFFHEEGTAKMSFWMCRILKHFNYTPRVWDLRMIAHKGQKVWCFMMERCTVVSHLAEVYGSERREQFYEKAVEYLNRRLCEQTDLYDADSHFANFGITPAGRPVCIDVGHISYSEIGMMKY